ncbi:MAG: hypothetical protein EXR70_16970 [Deltaproteobacteria bacterium]|nr:hypothetical protein [Deltaproteobacteria bacterium]
MATKKIPARLDVILAPKARRAVVLRRGPAKQVCTVGWDLSSDSFELGQWIEGRIHAYCCDLSADGEYFVYWIMKGHNHQGDYDWTAISRVPYLKAIARWKSSAGLPGGGLFVSDNKCRLHNIWYAYLACDEIIEEPNEPDDDFRYDLRNVYIRRQLRDGWKLHSKVGDVVGREVYRFEKPFGENRLLRNIFDDAEKIGLKRGDCPNEYEIVDSATGDVQSCRDWEWADIDGSRLLWAEGGKIFAADIETRGLGPAKMLYDFNDMTFQEIEAPY